MYHKLCMMWVVWELHKLNKSIQRRIRKNKQVIKEIKKREQSPVITSIKRKMSASEPVLIVRVFSGIHLRLLRESVG